MRTLTRIGGALLMLTTLALPPVAVAVWTRKYPWSWPTSGQLVSWLEQPVTNHAPTVAAAVLLVLAWLLLARLVILRAIQAIAAVVQRIRELRMPTPLQVTAGTVAGVAAVAVPTVAVAPAAIDAVAADATPPATPGGPPHEHWQADASRGIELPGGGWVPYPTALAVTAVGALVWLARRRHYTTTSPRPGHHHDDTDLHPLPPAADAITAAVTADRPEPPPPPTDLVSPVNLPTGRLNLSGPGAAGAARGLLATISLHAVLNPADAIQITIDQHALNQLLGHNLSEPTPPGLTVQRNSNHQPGPELTLTVSPHPGPPAPNPCGAVTQTIVTVGEPLRAGGSWHIEADGTISQPGTGLPHRLCVLPATACTDLIHLAQHAARHPTPAAAAPTAHRDRPATPGRLRLLGACELTINGGATQPRRSAGLQILAYLGTHPDGASTTDLLKALWPGHPPSAITKRLHTTLTDLRQQLHPMLNEPVTRRNERYQLNTDAIETDLNGLRQAITAAAAAVTPDQRRSAIDAITRIGTADLAPGYAWPWLQPVREQLRRDVIDACLLLATTANPAQAVTLLHTATTVDPFNTDLRHRAGALLHAVESTRVSETKQAHPQ